MILIAATAWLLWMHVSTIGIIPEGSRWDPKGSFESLPACEAQRDEFMANAISNSTSALWVTNMSKPKDGTVWFEDENGLKGKIKFICLPDNIDPRRR